MTQNFVNKPLVISNFKMHTVLCWLFHNHNVQLSQWTIVFIDTSINSTLQQSTSFSMCISYDSISCHFIFLCTYMQAICIIKNNKLTGDNNSSLASPPILTRFFDKIIGFVSLMFEGRQFSPVVAWLPINMWSKCTDYSILACIYSLLNPAKRCLHHQPPCL